MPRGNTLDHRFHIKPSHVPQPAFLHQVLPTEVKSGGSSLVPSQQQTQGVNSLNASRPGSAAKQGHRSPGRAFKAPLMTADVKKLLLSNQNPALKLGKNQPLDSRVSHKKTNSASTAKYASNPVSKAAKPKKPTLLLDYNSAALDQILATEAHQPGDYQYSTFHEHHAFMTSDRRTAASN